MQKDEVTTQDEILNMEEAAALFNVSIKTFIKLLKEEKVPARKIGREWRFSRQALLSWLADGDSQQYSSSETETKEYFNNIASGWDSIRRDYYGQSIADTFLLSGLLHDGMTVLDMGSGDGYLSIAAARYVKKVIAVDISVKMLDELKKNAGKYGMVNIETLESDALDIPLKDGLVDIICSSMFLHHIDAPWLAVKEMNRLLKPGGKVFLADFEKHLNYNASREMHDIWNGFNREEITEWFEKNGFTITSFDYGDKPGPVIEKQMRVFIMVAVKKNSNKA